MTHWKGGDTIPTPNNPKVTFIEYYIVRMFSPPAARHVPKPVQTASRRAETTHGDDVVLVNRHKSKYRIV